MGGKGSGGARVGSGPPRKPGSVRWLREQRKLRRVPENRPDVAPVAPVAVVGMPVDLPAGQAAVWAELAPHAIQARTLTPATAHAFRDLCEAIVLKRAAVSRIGRDGLMMQSGERHSLLPNALGLMGRVEMGLQRFGLAPMGKEMSVRDEARDEFAEFDISQPLTLVKGGK